MHDVNGSMLLKDAYSMVELDDCHWCRSVEMVQKDDGMYWALESMCMHYAFSVDCKPNSEAQAI